MKSMLIAAISKLLFISEIDVLVCLLVSVLIAIDFVTGVRAAYLRGDAVRSRGFRKTIGKVITYSVFIFCMWIFSNVLTVALAHYSAGWAQMLSRYADIIFVGAVVFLAWIEISSILENLTGKPAGVFWERLFMPLRFAARVKREVARVRQGSDSNEEGQG